MCHSEIRKITWDSPSMFLQILKCQFRIKSKKIEIIDQSYTMRSFVFAFISLGKYRGLKACDEAISHMFNSLYV